MLTLDSTAVLTEQDRTALLNWAGFNPQTDEEILVVLQNLKKQKHQNFDVFVFFAKLL